MPLDIVLTMGGHRWSLSSANCASRRAGRLMTGLSQEEGGKKREKRGGREGGEGGDEGSRQAGG